MEINKQQFLKMQSDLRDAKKVGNEKRYLMRKLMIWICLLLLLD